MFIFPGKFFSVGAKRIGKDVKEKGAEPILLTPLSFWAHSVNKIATTMSKLRGPIAVKQAIDKCTKLFLNHSN